MPKMKTRSGAKKRFTRTATGKINRSTAYRSHILTSKSTKRKRKLRGPHLVSKAEAKNIDKLLRH